MKFFKTKVDLYFRQEVLHTKNMMSEKMYRHRSIIPENFISQTQTIYENTRGQRNLTGSQYLGTGSRFFKNRSFIDTSHGD